MVVKIKQVLTAVIIFLATLAYMPHYLMVLPVFLFIPELFRGFKSFKQRVAKGIVLTINEWIVLIILILSSLNFIFHVDLNSGLLNLIPYFVLLIPTILIAQNLSRIFFQVLLFLICAEAAISLFEYFQGISTIIKSLPRYRVFLEGEGFDQKEVLGLSYNSSVVAMKILVALLIIKMKSVQLNKVLLGLLLILLAVASITTFNRTLFIVEAFLIAHVAYVFLLKSIPYKALLGTIVVGFLLIISVLVFLLIGHNIPTIDILTGRDHIWLSFSKFITEHVIFGNGSIKLWIGGYHAHNSFLELIATNGLVISCFYFLLILRNTTKENLVFVVAIILYSLTQYGMFWGISLIDILLIHFLGIAIIRDCRINNSEEKSQQRN